MQVTDLIDRSSWIFSTTREMCLSLWVALADFRASNSAQGCLLSRSGAVISEHWPAFQLLKRINHMILCRRHSICSFCFCFHLICYLTLNGPIRRNINISCEKIFRAVSRIIKNYFCTVHYTDWHYNLRWRSIVSMLCFHENIIALTYGWFVLNSHAMCPFLMSELLFAQAKMSANFAFKVFIGKSIA